MMAYAFLREVTERDFEDDLLTDSSAPVIVKHNVTRFASSCMDGRFPFYYAPGSFPSQDFRHFHPTLAGQILDLNRDPAEFCLIGPIFRQVW